MNRRLQQALPCAKPALALVLGSGGVKSIAGLGVAEVLHEQGLWPDLIVGCSAGAIFGALLALEMKTQEAMQLATQMWSREVTSKKRWRAPLELLLPRLMGFNSQRFAMRQDDLICDRLDQVFGGLRIEELPLRLRINATDAHTGERVVLERGPLAQALRASIALPFLFSPKRIAEQWLIDGSISDPLPVALAQEAKQVVAMGFQVPAPRIVDRASRLATRTTAALSNNLMQARLDAFGPGEMLALFPQLPRRIGLFETSAMPELIALGRQAAEAALPGFLQQQAPAIYSVG
ncbi:patatin-like phospholipase family protein [Paucibacter sp. KBW04]|uniref:patatin-like phospholipase family protein n=1 Tax=Paucibacter sp. KBW04 TaxID=2153361 RepID=UPI0018CC45C4|nr:patatin-like phospholipase family protein [Paucibacter sp. KBW04]